MRIEFLNQKGVLDFDIQKKYPLIYTETEDGKVVDELAVNPVKGQIEVTGDIIVDTGDLSIVDVLRVMKAIDALDELEHKKSRANFAAGYTDDGKPYAIELQKNTTIKH